MSLKSEFKRWLEQSFLKKLSLRDSSNMPVLDANVIFNMLFSRKLFCPLRDTYFKNKIDKLLLDSYYISRAELFKWCESDYLSLPQFWIEDNLISQLPEKLKEQSLRKSEKDKIACQALALAFWKVDPSIHPAHMAMIYALQHYGNAKIYTDPETVKKWIAEVDPVKDRIGRPRKKKYLLDLKTCGLHENEMDTFLINSAEI